MNKNDLLLKRGQLGTEAHSLLAKAGVTAEERKKAEALLNEADGITEQLTLMERSAKLEAEGRAIQPTGSRPQVDGEEDETRDKAQDKAYRNAFEVYMRLGEKALTAEERVAINRGQRTNNGAKSIMIGGEKRDITTTATGNYIIPQEFYNQLIGAKKFIGSLFGSVARKTTAGNGAPMKIGFENDTANSIIVVAEDTTVTEADPTLSGLISSTDTLATLIKVSKQEMADSGFDLNTLLRDRLGKRYLRGIENFIANGDASNIASLLTSLTTFATTVTNAGPGYEDYVATQTLLDPVYEQNSAWYMNKASRNYTMGLLDTLNRPLFLPNPQTGMLDQILGFPIKLTSYFPSATTPATMAIAYGDLEEGYLLRDDGEMTIQRLDERYADQLMVGFLAYTRVGGNVTDAGTHPIVGLKTHA
jgi:HK97 family phage major capsid protein